MEHTSCYHKNEISQTHPNISELNFVLADQYTFIRYIDLPGQ